MRARLLALATLSTAALAAPAALAGAPTPQVTDPAGDANFVDQGVGGPGVSAPFGSQSYGDVVSVLWASTKKAFTVTATLSGPPTPASGTTLVYRMLGQVADDASLYLGPVYYTTKSSDPAQPQSALRDNLDSEGATRLTPIDLPKISGSTITWTIPFTKLPKEFKKGKTITNLYFEVREIEDFHGQKVPDGVPSYGGATGLGVGVVDRGSSTSSFKVG
jgi:hypothetical protein